MRSGDYEVMDVPVYGGFYFATRKNVSSWAWVKCKEDIGRMLFYRAMNTNAKNVSLYISRGKKGSLNHKSIKSKINEFLKKCGVKHRVGSRKITHESIEVLIPKEIIKDRVMGHIIATAARWPYNYSADRDHLNSASKLFKYIKSVGYNRFSNIINRNVTFRGRTIRGIVNANDFLSATSKSKIYA